MKSEMTDDEILIAVAELDGWRELLVKPLDADHPNDRHDWPHGREAESSGWGKPVPDYLTSRDAIVPVIEKQNFTPEQWHAFFGKLAVGVYSIHHQNYKRLFLSSPKELCVALLKTVAAQY